MAKGNRRAKVLADKKARKAKRMENPGYSSNYARKKAYLFGSKEHRADQVWGFEITGPKPWK